MASLAHYLLTHSLLWCGAFGALFPFTSRGYVVSKTPNQLSIKVNTDSRSLLNPYSVFCHILLKSSFWFEVRKARWMPPLLSLAL